MLTQKEKSELCKKAFDEKWEVDKVAKLWEPLGFDNEKDMVSNILGMLKTLHTMELLFWGDICLHWCEYQWAAIDGRVEVAKQVSRDNIFRKMLHA